MTLRTGLMLAALLVSPGLAAAQTTMLVLNSEPGDWVGGGLHQTYNELDGTFVANQNGGNGVQISFHTPDFSHWWYLNFAAAGGAVLTPGAYEGATRFPFQLPDAPGLDVSGDGRGCNMLTGRFEVLEARFGPSGSVLNFAATFEQHCESMTPALTGLVMFNAGTQLPPTIELSVTGCTHCSPGQRLLLLGHLVNPGNQDVSVEIKMGLRLPDGTGVAVFGEHPVATLPAHLDVVVPLLNILWPAGTPAGLWHAEGTLIEPSLGRQFSRNVKLFEIEP